MFFISTLAETNRAPFDLPEGESEIVAGFFVEYSAMAFALFFLGEYANMILMGAMTTILFLGGWLPPFGVAPFTWIPGPVWFILKVCFCLFFFLWVRATFPRYRYDQLMRLGWKVFLPLSPAVAGADRRRTDAHRMGAACLIAPNTWSPADGVPGPHSAQHAARRTGLRAEPHPALFLQAQGDDQLPVRKGPDRPALQGRARLAPLSEWRGALHRLQAV